MRLALVAAAGAMAFGLGAHAVWAQQTAPALTPGVTPGVTSGATAGLTLDSAIAQALRQNPGIALSQAQIEAGQGAVLQARAPFDTVASAGASQARAYRQLRADEALALQRARLTPQDQITDTTTYRAGLDRTLESGAALGGAVVVTGTADNLQQVQGIPRQAAASLQFTLRVPLLKNAGRDTVTAALNAAGHELEAAQSDAAHANAQVVLNVALGYWDYAARASQLTIATQSEARARAMLAQMQRLVSADQVPRAELELISASVAERTAARILANQALAEARRALARLLGVSAADAARLGLPQQVFAAGAQVPAPPASLPPGWVDGALARRADLSAEVARELAARTRLGAARHNLKPQLDLIVAAGFVTNAENVAATDPFAVFNRRFSGPVASVGIAYQFPVRNSAAEGLVQTQSAGLDASRIRQRDLRAAIGTNIDLALTTIERAGAQLHAAREAAGRYGTALRNERTKRDLGTATLIDVLNVEDRYNNAHNAVALREQALANAIAQWRFESGLLVARERDTFTVQVEDLLSPRIDAWR